MKVRPCQLYRYFDAKGRLLYIGISLHVIARASQHAAKPWFANVARMECQRYPTRSEAEQAEKEAIRRERPLHNVVHNTRQHKQARPARERPVYKATTFGARVPKIKFGEWHGLVSGQYAGLRWGGFEVDKDGNSLIIRGPRVMPHRVSLSVPFEGFNEVWKRTVEESWRKA